MSNWGTIYVPNEIPPGARILFIGEAPGSKEEEEGRPFVGESGNKLEACLNRNGLPRATIGVANLFNYRPKNNRFDILYGTTELQQSLENLYNLLRINKPVVICTLGNWPTFFLTGKGKLHKRKNNPISGILNWRGSILRSNVSGLEDIKVIPTIHPAAILRDASLFPTFDQDIKRVKQESEFPELRLPERKFVIAPKGPDMLHWTSELLTAKKLTVDIENIKDSTKLLCIGFSPSPNMGVCFEYNEHDQILRDCLHRLLSSSTPKCFHFGTHDTEILRLNGYNVNGYVFDTFISQHIICPELPRSLAYLTSIHTREPYYKDEVKEDDPDTKAWSHVWAASAVRREKLYKYNCKDVCVDFEIWEAHEKELAEGPEEWRRFFAYEMEMLEVAHNIMGQGMLVDRIRMQQLKDAVNQKLQEQQKALNNLLGVNDGCCAFPCKCAKCVNVNSPKQIMTILYEALGLPPRFRKGSEGESKITTEEHALVSLTAFCKEKVDSLSRPASLLEWKQKLFVLKLILMQRGMRKMKSSYLDIRISDDGRMRGKFKVGGTETGRWAGEKYIDGTGANPQTFPRGGIIMEEEAA